MFRHTFATSPKLFSIFVNDLTKPWSDVYMFWGSDKMLKSTFWWRFFVLNVLFCFSFRPKYFHEVHGFIFVVDASDVRRMDETAAVFADIVANEKVQVKCVSVFNCFECFFSQILSWINNKLEGVRTSVRTSNDTSSKTAKK